MEAFEYYVLHIITKICRSCQESKNNFVGRKHRNRINSSKIILIRRLRYTPTTSYSL